MVLIYKSRVFPSGGELTRSWLRKRKKIDALYFFPKCFKTWLTVRKKTPQTLKEMLYFIVYPLSHWGKICNLFRVEECLNHYQPSAPKARIFSCWRMPGNRCWCQGAAMQIDPGGAAKAPRPRTTHYKSLAWRWDQQRLPCARLTSYCSSTSLQSMGSQRLGHDWATEKQKKALCTCFLLFPQQQPSHNNPQSTSLVSLSFLFGK